MRILIFTLLILAGLTAKSQSTYFKKFRAGGQTDYSRLSKTKDGGYIQIGYLVTPRDTLQKKGIVVTKFDNNTNVQWVKLYNDSSWNVTLNYPSATLNIEQLPDGNYVAACQVLDNYKKQNKILVFKIDSISRVIWSKSIGIDSSSGFTIQSQNEMKLIADNKIIITGNLNTGEVRGFTPLKASYVLKMNLVSGQIEWFNVVNLKHISGNSFENSSAAVNSETITLCGSLLQPQAYPINAREISWVVRYNMDGALISKKFFDIGTRNLSGFGKIITTADNGYLTTGIYYYGKRRYDMSVVKFDADLNIQWIKGIGKLDYFNYHHRERGLSIYNDAQDSSYIVGGSLYRSSLNNGLLLKLDKNGTKIWFNDLRNLGSNARSSVADIYKTDDGGYLTGGSSDNRSAHDDYFLLTKFAANGSSCYFQSFLPDTSSDIAYSEIKKEIVSESLLSSVSVSDITVNRNPDNHEMVTQCSSVLVPLNLLAFNAEKNGKANLLKWNISQESNTERFEIERSPDGNIFTSIGVEKARPDFKELHEYAYSDLKPFKGNNFYRLRIIDKNGSFEFSKIQKINNNSTTDIRIYPNPVKDDLVLHFNSATSAKAQIKIVNAEGKLLLTQSIIISQGVSVNTIKLSAFSTGYYFLKIITATEETNLQFIKY